MKISFLLFTGLLICQNILAQKPAEAIPDFKFFKLNNTSFTNKEMQRNTFSFFVFFDPGCDHCKQAIQALNQQYKKCKRAAIYLIVAIEDVSNMVPFLNEYGPNLLNKSNVVLLKDTQNEFIKKFKPRKYPSIFLYSKQQKLLLYSDDENSINTMIKLTSSSK